MAKKTFLTILLTLLSFGFIISPAKAAVGDLVVRIEEPKSPVNIKDIDLKFVALDILGRPVTVQCFKKSSTDSSFVQFGSDIVLTDGGNSSQCVLSSVMADTGSYQFKVTALAGSDSVDSQIVSLEYKTSTPDTPTDFRKEEINDCDYKIHFKTADDKGKTVKVEIYRSDKTSFDLNYSTLIASISIGSTQEYDITNSVPDCNKNYYYVVRAFDDAGNGSGTTGDSVTITNITTATSVTTTTGSVDGSAIPVVGSNIPSEGAEGEITPEEPSEGTILGTEIPNPKSITTQFQSFISRHKFSSALVALLVLIIIGYVIKKVRSKKR